MQPVGETRPKHSKEKCIRTGWPGTEGELGPAPPLIDCAGAGWRAIPRAGRRKGLLAWRHVAGEPLDCAIHYVAAMSWVDKAVAFIGVNHELRGHVLIAERMPELVGLRRGT